MNKPEGHDERTERAMKEFVAKIDLSSEAIRDPFKWTADFEKRLEDTLRDKMTSEDIFYVTFEMTRKLMQGEITKHLLIEMMKGKL